MTDAEKEFEKLMAKERQFYLRKTDIDSANGLPLKESQKQLAESIAEFEKKEAERDATLKAKGKSEEVKDGKSPDKTKEVEVNELGEKVESKTSSTTPAKPSK